MPVGRIQPKKHFANLGDDVRHADDNENCRVDIHVVNLFSDLDLPFVLGIVMPMNAYSNALTSHFTAS
jgi:hypothetical protein